MGTDLNRYLLERVRRSVLLDIEVLLRESSPSPTAQRWRTVMEQSSSDREMLAAILPDVVDSVVFQLLDEVDLHQLRLSLLDPESGEVVLTPEPGELAGDYLGAVEAAGSGDASWWRRDD